jgi:hypothetical protein
LAERIYKLQPNRTMTLRGFDHLGASAAIHSATANSFKVTGNFRDASDFCVLMLWDADDFYEHPCIKYLPDSSFQNLVLTFNVQYSGLQPLDSKKYPSIDWPYLDVANINGTTSQVRLFDHATQAGGTYTAASATFTIEDNGLQGYDHVTLWYRNFAFDYLVPFPATGVTAVDVVRDLVGQINAQNYAAAGATVGLQAVANGNQITITADRPGVDGNMVALLVVNKNSHLKITPANATLSGGSNGAVWTVSHLSGGSSDAVWTISLDFNALGLTDVRRMWLTFAPPLANAAAYAGGDWEAVFTNWTLSGPEDTKKLQVAGLNSVRVHHNDVACTYSGTYNVVTGFYDLAFAKRLSGIGTTARIRYSSAVTHDVYIGTSLAPGAGVGGVQLDGDVQTDLKCTLPLNNDPVITRRKVRSNVAPGIHILTLVVTFGQYIDFNYLEAAAPSDIPAPIPARSNISPALDYDTDHTYKLPPARILWNFDQLGFTGPINEYLGVFWWNQRIASGGTVPTLILTFGGTWANNDAIFLDIGAPDPTDHSKVDRTQQLTTISKSVIYTDTSETIAQHFADFINGDFSGIWASAQGGVLTIQARSAVYSFALEVSPSTTTAGGTITKTGTLADGVLPTWVVDTSHVPTLNTGVRAWHSDMYRLCKARGTDICTAISMELVYPPDNYMARFPDNTSVATATGFGTLVSSHCALGGPILIYQQSVLKDLAALQTAAGLTPRLQMGEFLWWFFPKSPAAPQQPGMAYYDAATKAAAAAALGRDLALFNWPDDDPQTNAGADATFLRNRLRDHVAALVNAVRAAYPNALFEVLLPVDVNYQTPIGPTGGRLGGRLNHFVNIPPEWLALNTAGFDYLKIEALAFGSWMRNLDLAREAIDFAPPLVWPSDRRRYLVPVFGTASPWQKEARFALERGYGVINLWAFDHISLYGWKVTTDVFRGRARASYQG